MSSEVTPVPAASAEAPAPATKDKKSSGTDKQKLDKSGAEKAAKKKKRDRQRKKAKRANRKNVLKTKVVVRRLPPNLPEETFMNAVKAWTGDDVVDYKYYVPGKISKSKAKQHVYSRAYFHMKSMEAVIEFHRGFDGHIFLDNTGNESRAVVEFAPFQKLPKEHKAPDTRQGTIDNDSDYLNFLEALEAEKAKPAEVAADVSEGGSQIERLENKLAMVSAQALAAERANKPTTTPLLEHLRAQKAAQAAAKAKAQAAKSAAKKVLKSKGAQSTSSGRNSAASNAPNASPSETNKKSNRRERKKKKEEKKGPAGTPEQPTTEKKASGTKSEKTGSSSSRSKKEGRKRSSKNKEGAASQQTSGSKNRSENGRAKPPVVKILGRPSTNTEASQSPNEPSSSKRSG
ncbi:Smg-4/UPF3 family-domain-containing protein [Radiomyces spectabilis]|uniref:Smg-4/UPF3 family-domain-containing protein n=1 Tax=Radiomyces spectabilis TaxID=64574 RepID=UPI0022206C3C|nr:Smg-4/UPF3 family-domain-containing protein [Radiomyces spectabilis]KAI8388641.1 Smg-4/UPF3 family-domain-containing protein [Radiomyces spectabilis]